jgi:glycosidase
MKKIIPLFLLVLLITMIQVSAQISNPLSDKAPGTILEMEPSCWWVGMKNADVQLMVYGNQIGTYSPSVSVRGVTISKVEKVENPNYLFVTLTISGIAKPGKIDLLFKNNSGEVHFLYELKERRKGSALRQGFTAADVIYLLMPDRFSNGNPANDSIPGMGDEVNRKKPNARHGGDIAGIENHLDYFNELGVTALWINPLLENKMPSASYHGYAITDFYKVDARFGTNEDYARLSSKTHAKGLKMIMDMVFNHCGLKHYWLNDLPERNWVHQWPTFTRSNFRSTILNDPYATVSDANQMTDGWFDTSMPDLNQQNPRLATYLIQNSIWWTEYADLDGIRMDTYPYSDKTFLASWCQSVLNEYPSFNIVGETWTSTQPNIAYWQANAKTHDGYNSYLPSVMDFPLTFAMEKAFDENEGWDTGMAKLYGTLTQDFVYPDPMNLLTFVDNHDVSRFNRTKDTTLNRFKMAMAFLLTTRGIPQLYYGTEILMTGNKSGGDGRLRNDFPGGWLGDKINAFTVDGRTGMKKEAFDYLSRLLKWRKGSDAVARGKLIHYVPNNGVYVYARFTDKERVIVILNNGTKTHNLSIEKYAEVFSGSVNLKDVVSGKEYSLNKQLSVEARSAMVLVVKK